MNNNRFAGDELSLAVAKAIGLKVYHDDALQLVGRFEYANDYYVSDDGMPHAIPEFATDANAALTLTVEGFTLQIRQLHEEINGVSWIAGYHKVPNVSVISASGKSPAEAICHARLALVNYPEPMM